MTTLQDRIAQAEGAVQQATGTGYDAYVAACDELAALQAELAAQQPTRTIWVIGNTYPHRRSLTALGLRWSADYHAWCGSVRGSVVLPRGCREMSHGEAAVASMDYPDSVV